MAYIPEGWVVFKIRDVYKVFGSWGGGYLDGDSWRINSGIESIEEEVDALVFKGYSGSEYFCLKGSYGRISGYNLSVLNNFIERCKNQGYDMFVYGSVSDFMQDWNESLEGGGND